MDVLQKTVKVSVVMPVYNGARSLPMVLDSLGNQSFGDFELIAVDDGSSDDSADVLRSYASRLNLKLITQDNAGASSAYNRGLDAAEGEYVYMMDQDDLVHPQLLELSVDVADRSGADYVVFDYSVCEEADLEERRRKFERPHDSAAAESLPSDALDWFLREGRNPGIWQFLLRRKAFAGRRYVPGITLEDNLYVFPFLADASLRGVHLRACLYAYVQRSTSVMHTAGVRSRMESLDVILTKLREILPDARYKELVRVHYLPAIRTLFRASDWRGRRCASVRMRSLMTRRLLRPQCFPLRWRLRIRLFGCLAPRWIRDRRFEGFVPEADMQRAFQRAGIVLRSIKLIPKFRHGVLLYRGETVSGQVFVAKLFDKSTRPGEGAAATRRLQILDGTIACRSLFADQLTEISHYDVACFSWCQGRRRYPDQLSHEAFIAFLDGYAKLSDRMQNIPAELLGWPTEPHPTNELKVLHGDFTANNVRFDDNMTAGVFDFEDMFLGYVAEDIIPYFYHAWCRTRIYQVHRRRMILNRLREAILHLGLPREECCWFVRKMRDEICQRGCISARELEFWNKIMVIYEGDNET